MKMTDYKPHAHRLEHRQRPQTEATVQVRACYRGGLRADTAKELLLRDYRRSEVTRVPHCVLAQERDYQPKWKNCPGGKQVLKQVTLITQVRLPKLCLRMNQVI